MSRKRRSGADALLEVTALLPWWAGVVAAVVSYLILHSLAAPMTPAAVSVTLWLPMWYRPKAPTRWTACLGENLKCWSVKRFVCKAMVSTRRAEAAPMVVWILS